MIYVCLYKSFESDDISALYPVDASHMYMRLFANTVRNWIFCLYQKYFIAKIMYINIIDIV